MECTPGGEHVPIRRCFSLDLILIGGLDEGVKRRNFSSCWTWFPACGCSQRQIRNGHSAAGGDRAASIVVTRVDACNNMSGLLAELRISGYPVTMCEK